MKYFLLISSFFLLFSCSKSSKLSSPMNDNATTSTSSTEESTYTECYQFDQRQCMTDSWADDIGLGLNDTEKEKRMKAYLGSMGLKVNKVKVNPKFHEFVCEACDTCPYEHRFFVELSAKGKRIIESLNLLNLSSYDCTAL